MQINKCDSSFLTFPKYIDFELEAAIQEKNIKEVMLLLQNNSDLLTQKNDGGASMLTIAIQTGSLEIVNVLLQYGVKFGKADEHGVFECLYCAIESGHIDIINTIFDRVGKIDANTMQELLVYACISFRLNVVKFLVEKGADPKGKDADGTPIIFEAIYCVDEDENVDENYSECIPKDSDLEIVSFLLEKGASANATDLLGNPLLLKAIERGSSAIVACLIKHGADCNAMSDGLYPLIQTAFMQEIKNYEIIKLLLGVGESITKHQLLTAINSGCDGSALNYLLSFAQKGVVDNEVISVAICELCNPSTCFFEIKEIEDQELCEIRRDSFEKRNGLDVFRLLVSKMNPQNVTKKNLTDAIIFDLPCEAIQILLSEANAKEIDIDFLKTVLQYKRSGSIFEQFILKRNDHEVSKQYIHLAIAGGISSLVLESLFLKLKDEYVDHETLLLAVKSKNFDAFEMLLSHSFSITPLHLYSVLITVMNSECSNHAFKKLASRLPPDTVSMDVVLACLRRHNECSIKILIDKLNSDPITVDHLMLALQRGATTSVMKELLKRTPLGTCNQELLRLAIELQIDILDELFANNAQLAVTHELFRLAAVHSDTRIQAVKKRKEDELISHVAAAEEIAFVRAQLRMLFRQLHTGVNKRL